jgi:hypothetical protein
MGWVKGQSGNPGGRPKGLKDDPRKKSLRRLMDRVVSAHENEVEAALLRALKTEERVIPGLDLWGRVRRELGPGAEAPNDRTVLNVAIVLESSGAISHAALPPGGLEIHLDGGNGANGRDGRVRDSG